MAQDEELAARVRGALAGEANISEKRMMGGLCFFLNGNMLGGANRTKEGERRFMFRVGKGNIAAAQALPGGVPVLLGDRLMPGFFYVDGDDCDDARLARWLALALSHARGLPPK